MNRRSTEVARKKFKYSCMFCLICTSFGSNIVFPFGHLSLYTACLDTSKRPLKFQVLPPYRTHAKDIPFAHSTLNLGEVDGKLYRVDSNVQRFQTDPDSSAFEVFDPQKPGRYKWRNLPTPPFIRTRGGNYKVMFLDAAKKVIGFNYNGYPGYYFDTTNPEMGWTYMADAACLFGRTYKLFQYKPFFALSDHPDLGDFHLKFDYNPDNLDISAVFISNDLDTVQPIDTHVQLTDLCSDPTLVSDYTLIYRYYGVADYEFVHLGPQRVALVLHEYLNEYGGKEVGYLLLIEFEYEIITTPVDNSKPTLDIQFRAITTRRFEYPYSPSKSREPGEVLLNGAFLL